MGPLATLDFLRKVLDATPARVDQDHVPVVTSSIPQIPDRTAAFRGQGESPLPALVASGERLKRAGAGLIVIPCNTAHLWFEPLQQALGLPMLHLVDAALDETDALVAPGAPVGLLGTAATIESRLYVDRRQDGRPWLLPTTTEMQTWVMPGIEAVKAGDSAGGATLLVRAAQALADRGAEALLLGCTEIPLVLDRHNAPRPVVDATAALARRSVAWALARRTQTAPTAPTA
ncbi:amino acid racemase [Xylophilus sp. Kf1]|nr:amino acid racemase [Xylophilus sp. Kf1]